MGLVAGEKEKDDAVDDIDDVICAGKEVPALELGAFRLRSFASVPFETRNSSHIGAILSYRRQTVKKEPVFTNWQPRIYTVLGLPLMMTVSYAITDFFHSFSA